MGSSKRRLSASALELACAAGPTDDALPLPEHLQKIVDAAPKVYRTRLDAYFERQVQRLWSDPAAQEYARAVYYDRLLRMRIDHLSVVEDRDTGYFAAEMRVLREDCRR